MGHAGNIFEKMQWLRGYEELMVDISLNKDRLKVLGEKICEYIVLTAKILAGLRIDGIEISDYWGKIKKI